MRKICLISLVILLFGIVQGHAQLLPYNDSLQIKKQNIEQEKIVLRIDPDINSSSSRDVYKKYLVYTGLCAVGSIFNKSPNAQLDCRMPKQTMSERVEQHLLKER